MGLELSIELDERVLVSDESSRPDLEGLEDEARRGAIEALKALEQAASRRAFHEGFLAGWDGPNFGSRI